MQVFDAASLDDDDFEKILSFLDSGGVIGFPTDTAYGLGADPFNECAVRQLFVVKERRETLPILLIVSGVEMAATVARLSLRAQILAARFWPGPLTLVLPALPGVPEPVTAGTGTVGVRWPASEFAVELLRRFGRPITATSANVSGRPAPLTAGEVVSQLEGRLEMLVDGGTLPFRGGSSVLDLTRDPPVLLRDGPVSFAELTEALEGRIVRNGN